MNIIQQIFGKKKTSGVTLSQLVKFPHYETIFKISFFFVFALCVYQIYDVILFREFLEKNNFRRFSIYELKWLFIGLILIHLGKEINSFLFYGWVLRNINQKYQGQERILRARKITKWFFDVIYYTLSSVTAYYLFYDEIWFPSELGGRNYKTIFGSYPDIPLSQYLPIYYMVQAAQHIHGLLVLLVHGTKVELKFWEYILHHSLAVFLIYFSSMYNCVTHGVMVLITHDISDIFLALGRAYGDIQNSKSYIVIILVFFVQFSWIYTRLYVFPSKILESIYRLPYYETMPYWSIVENSLKLQIFLKILLFCMHIYWTIYMLKVNLSIFKAGQYKNVYDNREMKIDNKNK